MESHRKGFNCKATNAKSIIKPVRYLDVKCLPDCKVELKKIPHIQNLVEGLLAASGQDSANTAKHRPKFNQD